MQPVAGVGEADDALFYVTDTVSVNAKQVFLHMTIVSSSKLNLVGA